MKQEDKIRLLKMKTTIEQLEKLALELKELGRGIPAVEKNSQNILYTAYVLKTGISDVTEIDAV